MSFAVHAKAGGGKGYEAAGGGNGDPLPTLLSKLTRRGEDDKGIREDWTKGGSRWENSAGGGLVGEQHAETGGFAAKSGGGVTGMVKLDAGCRAEGL